MAKSRALNPQSSPVSGSTAEGGYPSGCLKAQVLFRTYRVIELLGKGRFGTIWRCAHRVSGEEVACKQVEKTLYPAAARELVCLQQAQGHAGVLRLEGVYESKTYFYLVTELCSAGDLFDAISTHGAMGEESARRLFGEVASALGHCHSLGIIHRDIKPENIMLQLTEEEGFAARLGDFGLAVQLAPGERVVGCVGSEPYEAPEVLGQRPYDSAADVWSMGVLLYGVLSAAWPEFASGREFVPRTDFSGAVWDSISSEAKCLISQMLQSDPQDRPCVEDILRHPWFAAQRDTWQEEATPDADYSRAASWDSPNAGSSRGGVVFPVRACTDGEQGIQGGCLKDASVVGCQQIVEARQTKGLRACSPYNCSASWALASDSSSEGAPRFFHQGSDVDPALGSPTSTLHDPFWSLSRPSTPVTTSGPASVWF